MFLILLRNMNFMINISTTFEKLTHKFHFVTDHLLI